jgi:hypothetical protein
MARTASTRHFANTLRRAIDDYFEGNMSELSRKSGVALGTIGHYVRPGNDGRFPSVEQAEKLMKALPKDGQMELARAMIADVVPKSFLSKVEIRPAGSPVKAAPIVKLKGLPESTMEAIEFLAGIAAESLEVRRMLETTAMAMGMRRK